MTAVLRPLVRRALEHAGLREVAERVLAGAALTPADAERLRAADVLAVAALADAVRERAHGDEVVLIDLGVSSDAGLEGLVLARPELGVTDGATGLDALREVAMARLTTPFEHRLGVSFDALGEGLAQAALTFGASVLVGTLTRRAVLPLADDASSRAKRAELLGRVERAGRRARWLDDTASSSADTSGSAQSPAGASA